MLQYFGFLLLVLLPIITNSFQSHTSAYCPSFYSTQHSLTRKYNNDVNVPEITSTRTQAFQTVTKNIAKSTSLLTVLSLLAPLKSKADEEPKILTRADVGQINLNTSEPIITDVCWLDVQIGTSPPQRVEISLYGTVTPITAANFKALCVNKEMGYTGSEFFRIISEFSVQAGNVGCAPDEPNSKRGRVGRAASGVPFQAENFRIMHSYKNAGVVSMIKNLQNASKLDSRFFITLKKDASWADDRYSAFGRVSKGMDFIQSMIIIPVTAPANYPKTLVKIVDSGCYDTNNLSV